MKKIRAWHFCRKNEQGIPVLGYDSTELEVAPGYVYSIDDDRTVKGERKEPAR